MDLPPQALRDAIATVPPGRYALAVSGGADSVAMMHLLRGRNDLSLVVVHLDHETRAGQSTIDAQFVSDLATSLNLSSVIRRRSDLEQPGHPANKQAHYRALRLALYHLAIRQHGLDAVLQAHHADDQAETVLMRLLRGTGIEGLSGISWQSVVSGMVILRPLLAVRRKVLREFLAANHLPWREDASNATPDYQRNRVRLFLGRHEHLVPHLLNVGNAFAALAAELDAEAGDVGETLPLNVVAGRHPLVQFHLLRRFSLYHGAIADDLTIPLLERLRSLVEDAAAGPSVCLPGGIEIRRRSRELIARKLPRPAV